ncbi:MAG: LysR family transcriptional regulator [Leptolyngbya sp. SIO1E4]|nr:LysR family transcriptional regulator [Leptolyngbya sp. SIO1E4]
MEIYQLKVFLEVARCLSFTEAADTLSLTQPAVSAKIKSLESELGTPLFKRLGRRIELTQAGEYLLEEGPQLVDLEGQLLSEIESIKQGKFNTLKIGGTVDIIHGWLPSRLYDYRRVFPDVQTQCVCFDSVEKLYRAIKQGEVDLGISGLSFSKFDEISETVIDTIHYSLVVSHSHSLVQHPWLSLKELAKQSWVLLPQGFPSRIILQERMHELGLNLANFAHVETVDVPSLIPTYLLRGHHVSFASDFEFQVERQAGLIREVPLEEFALGTPLFLLMSKRLSRALDTYAQKPFQGRQTLEPIQQFIRMLQTHCQAASDSCLSRCALAPSRVHGASTPANENPLVPRFQAPNFLIRSGKNSPSATFKLTIGTQNQTIQTVTAGLIIQRLKLLEHFLPREGRYSNTQYQIQWADYSSGAPIVAGLRAQAIDIGVLGDYPLLLSAVPIKDSSPAAGTRLISFVASNPDGTGNDIVVPHHSRLNSVEDLAGRIIAVPFGSAAHGMVMRSLHHRQLLHEVTLTSVDNLNVRRLAKNSPQVDGYAYFAPLHEIAKHKGQFRRLLQGSLDGLPTFHGVVIRDDFAEEFPEIAIAYLKALLAAQSWYATQPLATTLVSRWVNMDAAIVAKTLWASERCDTEVVYRPETQLRADWLQVHIGQLSQIDGQEHLGQINLDRWMQPEFLEQAIASI